MRKPWITVSAILILGLIACTNGNIPEDEPLKVNHSVNQNTTKMKNLVSIIEIPTEDFSRAVAFYQTILDISIEEVEMGEDLLGLFPNEDESGSVHLIHGKDYKPSTYGSIVYLNAGDDLQKVADKIEANGGEVLHPKTEIGPDMGFFALFLDSEGNKLGLYSGN